VLVIPAFFIISFLISFRQRHGTIIHENNFIAVGAGHLDDVFVIDDIGFKQMISWHWGHSTST